MASPTSATSRAHLAQGLERLYASCDFEARRGTDPVRFPRRYARPQDQEIAAVLAGSLAYGRVTLFGPVLQRLLDQLDSRGGPRAFVEGFTSADQPVFSDFRYRFNGPDDLVLLFTSLRRLLAEWGSLGALATHHHRGPTMQASLEGLVSELGRAAGPGHTRGFRYWLSRPSGGSACKRWCMVYRWMVRGADEGIDLGCWELPRSALLIPVDTHVLRIGRMLGLTRAKTGSWRVAREITGHLRELDPLDPVRFDFALAHLGISGACAGRADAALCPACPLQSCCSG